MSNGASSFSQKSATQSSLAWNSGSVEKSHAIVFLLRRGCITSVGAGGQTLAFLRRPRQRRSVHDDRRSQRDPSVEPGDVPVVHPDAAVADRVPDAPVRVGAVNAEYAVRAVEGQQDVGVTGQAQRVGTVGPVRREGGQSVVDEERARRRRGGRGTDRDREGS